MKKNMKMNVCVCVRLKYHAVYLKPKQHCELTTLQLKRKKKKKLEYFNQNLED